MPRTKEANELVRKKKKKLICNSALRLFCKKGYEKVGMDEIAKEAKISHGLVYHYFAKKSDILNELVKIGNSKMSEFVNFEYLNSLKGEEYFKYLTDIVIKALELGDVYSYYICLYINFKMAPSDYDNFSDISYYSKFEKHFTEGQKQGIFAQGNSKYYLLCYLHLISSLIQYAVFQKNQKTIPPANVIMNCLYKTVKND